MFFVVSKYSRNFVANRVTNFLVNFAASFIREFYRELRRELFSSHMTLETRNRTKYHDDAHRSQDHRITIHEFTKRCTIAQCSLYVGSFTLEPTRTRGEALQTTPNRREKRENKRRKSIGDRKRNGWHVGRASVTVSFNFAAFVNARVLSDIINGFFVTPLVHPRRDALSRGRGSHMNPHRRSSSRCNTRILDLCLIFIVL